MADGLPPTFDVDPYFERLLTIRKTDPAAYNMYPDEVKRLIEEYERERETEDGAGRATPNRGGDGR